MISCESNPESDQVPPPANNAPPSVRFGASFLLHIFYVIVSVLFSRKRFWADRSG